MKTLSTTTYHFVKSFLIPEVLSKVSYIQMTISVGTLKPEWIEYEKDWWNPETKGHRSRWLSLRYGS